MTSWTSRTSPIKTGDRVAYSARFLRSIGAYTGDLPFARGTVTEIKKLGETTIAVIDWGNEEMASKVNVVNLCRVQDIAKDAL